MIPGIPAVISNNFLEAGIALAVALVIFGIYLCKAIPRNYVQFLVAIVICSFNNTMFFLPINIFDSISKSTIFFRGYSFASVNMALLARFSSLKQKIVLLAYAYALRVTIMVYFDTPNVDPTSIVRSLYVDLFVLFINFFREKKIRSIFKSWYEYREEHVKFKELLSNYFPQSIAIFKNFKEKPLFLNQAFINVFGQLKEDTDLISNTQNIQENSTTNMSNNTKLDLKNLQVDKNTIREVGKVPYSLKFSNEFVCFEDVLTQLIQDKSLNQKPICFSASYPLNNENKLFDVVLTKIKWSGEDATAIILNDITYQEKLISLKIADVNKDQIIATVSHELRTPLNGIIGILGIAEKSIKDQKVIEYLGLCQDNAHLLLNLVNSLLDLHQVRQGKLRLNPTKVDINQVLKEVVRLFAFQSNNKGIYLKLNISEGIPRFICTDENRLKQILINLIGNALKFTLEGGITVELDQDPLNHCYLKMSVLDTGIGIKEEDKGKLFQLYEKIEHSRSVNKNGVGLGLTISNTLAGLLSGKTGQRAIEVHSNLHKGSKFSFKILKDLNNQVLDDIAENTHKILIQDIRERDFNSFMCSQEEIHIPKELSTNPGYRQQGSPSKIERYILSINDSNQVLTAKKVSNSHNVSPIIKDYSFQEEENIKEEILVVDDNAFNLLVVENMIKELGYSFKGAKSGLEAIEVVKLAAEQLKTFKVILMDCQMPVMDGFETTRILRTMMDKSEIPNIPIIALTANNGEEDIKQCYASGMVAHLSKPLFAKIFVKTLEEFTQDKAANNIDS